MAVFNGGFHSNWGGANVSGGVSNLDNAKADGGGYATFAATENYCELESYPNLYGVPDTITGIEVIIDAWSSAANAGDHLDVKMTWDGASNWSDSKRAPTSGGLPTGETRYTLGGSTDLWGRESWAQSDFVGSDFRLRIDSTAEAGHNIYIDYIAIKIYFEGGEVCVQISANTDDGYEQAGAWAYDSSPMPFGNNTYTGLRFINIGLDQAEEVSEAYLWLFPPSSQLGSAIPCIIAGVDEDNFEGWADSEGDRPSDDWSSAKTTAETSWSIGNLTQYTAYKSANFATVINEILARGGWSSGNAIGIMVAEDNASGTRNFYEFKDGKGAWITLIQGVAHEKELSDSQSITEALAKAVEKPALAEAVSLAESLANKSTLGVSDSQSISESLATVKEFYRSLADSQSIAESLTAVNEFYRSLSDVISIAESKVKSSGLPKSDSMAVSESLANKTTLRLSDSVGFVESLARIVEFYLSLSDSVSFADGTGKDVKLVLSDSISIVEAVSLEPQPNLSDSISIAEAISLQPMPGLSDASGAFVDEVCLIPKLRKSEYLTIEGTVTSKSIVVSLSDALSIAEAISAYLHAYKKSLSDSISIAESLTKISVGKGLSASCDLFAEIAKGVGKPFSETLAISESLAGQTTLSLSDSLPISESVRTVGIQTLSDSLDISESLARAVIKSLSDSVLIAESEQKAITIPFTESVPISEAVANGASLALSDSIPIIESSARVNEFYRTPTDAQIITESEAKTITKALSDSIEFSDAKIEKEIEHLEDSLTLVEEISTRSIVKALDDSLSIADSEVEAVSLTLSDDISISEAMVAEKGYQRFLSDLVAFGESLVLEIGLGKAESLPIAETLLNQTTLRLADSVSIAESEVESVGIPGLEDSVAISEAVAKAIIKSLTDSMAITDTEIEAIELGLSDSLAIAEAITTKDFIKALTITLSIVDGFAYEQFIELEDSLSVSESFAKAVEYYLGLFESIAIVDSAIGVSFMPLEESVSISEAITKNLVKTFLESVTIIEEYESDWLYSRRLGRKTYLRTIDDNRTRRALIRSKY